MSKIEAIYCNLCGQSQPCVYPFWLKSGGLTGNAMLYVCEDCLQKYREHNQHRHIARELRRHPKQGVEKA